MKTSKKLQQLKAKQIKKSTIFTSYDNCKKYTLLEWLKLLEEKLATIITKENEGAGILLTFKEDGELDKISAEVTKQVLDSALEKKQDVIAIVDIEGEEGTLTAEQRQLLRAPISYIRHDKTLYRRTYAGELNNEFSSFLTEAGRNTSVYVNLASGHWYFKIKDFQYKITKENEGENVILEFNEDGTLKKINAIAQPPEDVVTLSTQQTITGFKAFENNNGIALRNVGTAPNRQTYINEDEIRHNPSGTEKIIYFSRIVQRNEMEDYVTNVIAPKQNKEDNNLDTISKNIVGAINEVNAKTEGGTEAYVISTANGKNPNFISDAYDIEASQIELQDGTIIPIASIPTGKTIYVLEESVSDRWYSGNGHFIRLQEKTILDDYQLKATLDADVEALSYIKESGLDAKVTALGYVKNSELDSLVGGYGYIKGITHSDILEYLEGSKFISVDYNPTTEKIEVEFDFTNIDEFIDFAEGQEVVASWTEDKKLQLNLKQELSNKINNSLQLPLTHTEETLVGVDTTGAQEQVKIDSETLEIINGILKAKIPTPQEVHLYEHMISFSYGGSYATGGLITIITTSNAPFTTSNIVEKLQSLYSSRTYVWIYDMASVYTNDDRKEHIVINVRFDVSSGKFTLVYFKDDNYIEYEWSSGPTIVTDSIRQII